MLLEKQKLQDEIQKSALRPLPWLIIIIPIPPVSRLADIVQKRYEIYFTPSSDYFFKQCIYQFFIIILVYFSKFKNICLDITQQVIS